MSGPAITFVCEFPTLNGGERSLLAVLDHPDPTQWRPHFVAPGNGPLADEVRSRGIPLTELNLRNADGSRPAPDVAGARLLAAVARTSPDIVHANSLSMGRLLGRIRSQVHVPCTTHLRDIIGLSGAAVGDLNRNDRLIAVSQATRDAHVRQGLDSSRVEVLYNGIDCDRFRPGVSSGSLREQLRIAANAQLAIAIGQIGLRKGWETTIAAHAQLAGDWPQLHLLIVGTRQSEKAESVAYERQLHGQVSEAGLRHRVHWLGNRDDVPSLLDEADVLLHAAKQEPLGRVLLEAAACGTAIVATNVGGTPEILTDGTHALLVPPGDRESMTKSVARLLADDSLRTQLAGAARRRVIEQFSSTQRAAEHWEMWTNVLNER